MQMTLDKLDMLRNMFTNDDSIDVIFQYFADKDNFLTTQMLTYIQ